MKPIIAIQLILLLQLTSSCYQKAEPETYLIRSNYIGEVNILFNQSGVPMKYKNDYNKDTIYTTQIGTSIKYENGRRVYEIPDNGLLLTQFEKNDGFIDRQYYVVDEKGKRTALPVFEFKHFKKDSAGYIIDNPNKKGIFGDGTTGSLGNMNIPFQNFTICSYDQLDSFFSKEYQTQFQKKLEGATGLKLQ